MAADGSIIIDTRIDTTGFKNGAVNMKSQFAGMKNVIGKIGAAIGAAFAVHKIIEFGKEAVELGSDLQEVQNVVDVTFTTMADKVNEFAQSAAVSAGLSETMAKKFTGTFGAMAKSFGFVEVDAYEMSKSLTQLAGDVASFYNITQDMAYTKLKSVFTGETESLKDLGVVMTQSALDAYALANGFGKTTSAMSEQEKVALRYRFVMDQLSAASGDFVRTSDGWANQVRILKLQFDSLKATIGQGLINLLTPVLKMINTLLAKLNTLAASFKAFTEMISGKKSSAASMSSGYNAAVESADALASATEGVAGATKEATKEAKAYLSPLDEINKLSEADKTSGGDAAAVGGGTSIDYGQVEEGNALLEQTSEELSKIGQMLAPLKEAWSEYGGSIKTTLGEMSQDVIETGKDLGKGLAEWGANLNWKPLFSSFSNLLEVIKPFTDLISDRLLWAYENVLLPFGKWTIEKALPAGLEFLSTKIERAAVGFEIMSNACIWLYDNVLKELARVIGDVVIDGIDAFSGLTEFVTGVFSGDMEKAFSGLERALSAFQNITETIFDYLKNKIMAPFDEWLANVLVHDWREEFGILGSIGNSFFADIKNIWNALKQIFGGINTFLKGTFTLNWRQAWDGVKEIFAGVFKSLEACVYTPLNAIIAIINSMIDAIFAGINGAINAINGINVSIPSWVPYYGGKTYGPNIRNVNPPFIPYLASGAVIPPNAPFTAVLGDQKNGTNLEAPEGLIRKIVREESGGAKGYTFVGKINRRVLFEEFISEAKLRQQTTGRNPFEFA